MAPDLHSRGSKALRAMKNIGITPARVKPVLKRLLKLFDGNWEHIEEENYRALADAIFDDADDQLTNENNGDPINGDADHPSEKLPKSLLKVDSPKDNGNKTLELEEGKSRRSYDRKGLVEPSQPLPGDPRSESHLHVHREPVQNKGLLGREKIRDRNFDNVIDANKKQRTHCLSQLSLPASNVDPDKPEKNDGSGPSHGCKTPLKKTHDIASSTCGQVTVPTECHHTLLQPSHCGTSDSVAPMVTHQKPLDDINGERVRRRIRDITNGTEKVCISLVDEIGGEDVPKFTYIQENTIYQSAYIHISLARIADEDCCSSCTGDCLSSSVPCACARDTRGEFAYTQEGLLTEEFLKSCISMKLQPQEHYQFFCQDCPLERAKKASRPEKCKGHPEKKFIKECWIKCGCNKRSCGNRVVQRGITRKLQVFMTNRTKGWGLRTLEKLPKGSFVCEYAGEILTNMELYERNKSSTGKYRHTYPVLLDADWCSEKILNDKEALCLDATYYGNVARFINHRCFDSNLLEVPVQVETPDRHYYHIAFFTKREVDALEELTWDYGIDFEDHNHPIEAFKCTCGSEYCRNSGRKK